VDTLVKMAQVAIVVFLALVVFLGSQAILVLVDGLANLAEVDTQAI
jgi:hypothetical protein